MTAVTLPAPIKSDQAAAAARKARLKPIDEFYGPILDDIAAEEQARRAAAITGFWARMGTIFPVFTDEPDASLLAVTDTGRLVGEYSGWATRWVLSALADLAGQLAQIQWQAGEASHVVRSVWDEERYPFAFGIPADPTKEA